MTFTEKLVTSEWSMEGYEVTISLPDDMDGQDPRVEKLIALIRAGASDIPLPVRMPARSKHTTRASKKADAEVMETLRTELMERYREPTHDLVRLIRSADGRDMIRVSIPPMPPRQQFVPLLIHPWIVTLAEEAFG